MPILTVYARLTAMALRWAHTSNDFFVAKVGLEPTRSLPPGDFKSPTSRQFRHSARLSSLTGFNIEIYL